MAHLILLLMTSSSESTCYDVKFGQDLNVIRPRARKECDFTKRQFNLRGGKKLLDLIMVDPLAVTLIWVGAVDATVITFRPWVVSPISCEIGVPI
ncbi:hypothetical protein E4U40_001795 [Claviceps sp. LM458 group G5]|nr:hypothetical protein E4U40_001795 [Claviceps sp. LM458 group G5]